MKRRTVVSSNTCTQKCALAIFFLLQQNREREIMRSVSSLLVLLPTRNFLPGQVFFPTSKKYTMHRPRLICLFEINTTCLPIAVASKSSPSVASFAPTVTTANRISQLTIFCPGLGLVIKTELLYVSLLK